MSPGGGETASIDVESELSFVFDATDTPVEGDELLPDGGSDIIFLNTEASGSVSVTARNLAGQDCPQSFPDASYSVQPKVFTEIDVACL